MKYYIHADGSCYNHPEHNTVGFAAVLSKNPDPELTDVIEVKYGSYTDGTNNMAEWSALIAALELLLSHSEIIPQRGPCSNRPSYQIYLDSDLVVNQSSGFYRVRNKGLKPLYKEFKALQHRAYRRMVDFDINWISRKQNKTADLYSKAANPHFKEQYNGLLPTT